MLQYITEQLNEYLMAHGVITDVVLRSERSLIEDEETREITLDFMEQEEEGYPIATIHLFLLPDEQSCEVEVEITCTAAFSDAELHRIWSSAKEIVAEIALTEKRRYVEDGKRVEAAIILDYHFIVGMPESEAAESEWIDTLQRFATDLGKLVRLAR